MNALLGKQLSGIWWEPERPDRRFKGTLLIKEDHHGNLTLTGTEEEFSVFPIHGAWRVFWGQIDERLDITLFNAGMESGPSVGFPKRPDRETKSEFYTNNILFGMHLANEDTPFAERATVHFTGLEEWLDVTGFSGATRLDATKRLMVERADISFQAKQSEFYDLGDGRTLRFNSDYRGPTFFENRKHIELRESNSIELRFPNPISSRQLQAEISVWQSLVTLGLRRPTYKDEVVISTSKDGFRPLFLIVPGRRTEQADGRLNSRSVLFNQSKLGPRIGERLRLWRERQGEIETAVNLLGGTDYQDGQFNYVKLLAYLQALETLHRERFTCDRFPTPDAKNNTIGMLRCAIPKDLSGDLRKEISDQLGYLGSLTLLDRLKHLFSTYRRSLTPLFPDGDASMSRLKDVRNFLTHYGSQKKFGRDFLWSSELHILKEKTRLFLEICLLGAMGMNDEEVFSLVAKFEQYNEWRFEAAAEAAKRAEEARKSGK